MFAFLSQKNIIVAQLLSFLAPIMALCLLFFQLLSLILAFRVTPLGEVFVFFLLIFPFYYFLFISIFLYCLFSYFLSFFF